MENEKSEHKHENSSNSTEQDPKGQEDCCDKPHDKKDCCSDHEEPVSTPKIDFKEKFYYLAAEMENVRKRYEREKDSLVKYGNERILRDLLEVMDNFDRTIQSIKNDQDEKIKNLHKGMEMVATQLIQLTKKYGLETVPTIGQIFDPNIHEAISQIEVEEKADGEIINEFQKGYVLNGRLLRPAKVVLASLKIS